MMKSLINMQMEELEIIEWWAEQICDSEAYNSYIKDGKNKLSVSDMVLKLAIGWEMGLSVHQTLTGLYNEHGRLTMNVDTMMAMVQASGKMTHFNIVKSTDEICIIEAAREGGEIQTFTFTFEDAERMGIISNDRAGNYNKQPAVMLYKRDASKMIRTMFSDIAKGMYVEGEMTSENEPDEYEDSQIRQEYVSQNGSDEQLPDEKELADNLFAEGQSVLVDGETYQVYGFEWDEEDEIWYYDIGTDEMIPEDEIEEPSEVDQEEIEDDEYDEDDDDFNPIEDMIEMFSLKWKDGSILTPNQYEIGAKEFIEWCAVRAELGEDDSLEDWILDMLEYLKYPVYSYEDDDGGLLSMIVWSPSFDELYKGGIETHLELNTVGFDEDEPDLSQAEEIVDEDVSQDEDDEEYDDDEEDEEEYDDFDWDDDDWDEDED